MPGGDETVTTTTQVKRDPVWQAVHDELELHLSGLPYVLTEDVTDHVVARVGEVLAEADTDALVDLVAETCLEQFEYFDAVEPELHVDLATAVAEAVIGDLQRDGFRFVADAAARERLRDQELAQAAQLERLADEARAEATELRERWT